MNLAATSRSGDPLEIVRRSISDMELAADDAGIERNGALGIWVRTSARTLEAMAVLVREQRESIERAVTASKDRIEAELDRAREVTARSENALLQLQAAAVATGHEKERVLGAMVASMAPDLKKALRETVILKEWRHNKRLNALHYVKVGSVALLLAFGGYAVHVAETWAERGAVARCLANTEQNAAGRRYCPVEVLLADAVTPSGAGRPAAR